MTRYGISRGLLGLKYDRIHISDSDSDSDSAFFLQIKQPASGYLKKKIQYIDFQTKLWGFAYVDWI